MSKSAIQVEKNLDRNMAGNMNGDGEAIVVGAGLCDS